MVRFGLIFCFINVLWGTQERLQSSAGRTTLERSGTTASDSIHQVLSSITIPSASSPGHPSAIINWTSSSLRNFIHLSSSWGQIIFNRRSTLQTSTPWASTPCHHQEPHQTIPSEDQRQGGHLSTTCRVHQTTSVTCHHIAEASCTHQQHSAGTTPTADSLLDHSTAPQTICHPAHVPEVLKHHHTSKRHTEDHHLTIPYPTKFHSITEAGCIHHQPFLGPPSSSTIVGPRHIHHSPSFIHTCLRNFTIGRNIL